MFLAFHIDLEEYRAVKRVPKSSLLYEQFRKEALLMKELSHPGIPVVYDLEEDTCYSYLIEEYVEGESLYDLVRRLGYLTKAKMVQFGIQICQIINYLHFAGTYPILYLDLQPKNLIICHEKIKLIDFDHSAYAADANSAAERYGTVGYAAPEQYTDETLDERTDIYAVGAIIYFMGTGCYPRNGVVEPVREWGEGLTGLIAKCISIKKEDRYQSANELCEKLKYLENLYMGVFKGNQLSSLNLALVGSKPGVGTTHLSIGLSVYLQKSGIYNLYKEKNQSGAVLQLGAYFKSLPNMDGTVKVKDCVMLPKYSEYVKLKCGTFQIVVNDYGNNLEEVRDNEDLDLIILVCGGKWWEMQYSAAAFRTMGKKKNLRVVFNNTCAGSDAAIPSYVKRQDCLRAPHFENPFCLDADTQKFFEQLTEGVLHDRKGALIRRLKERLQHILKRRGM